MRFRFFWYCLFLVDSSEAVWVEAVFDFHAVQIAVTIGVRIEHIGTPFPFLFISQAVIIRVELRRIY